MTSASANVFVLVCLPTPSGNTVSGARRRRRAYTARFAAKEAVVKALGRGIGWLEAEVLRDGDRPLLQLHGRALEFATAAGIDSWHLSLSHDGDFAVAYVIAERSG